MSDQLTKPYNNANFLVLVSDIQQKDELHRLATYARWLDEQQRIWLQPNLVRYRDYLLTAYEGRDGKPLSGRSVKAHLSTIRARYRALLRDNTIRDELYAMIPSEASVADRKAIVDELLKRVENAIDPDVAPVKTVKQQDVHDEVHLRLSAVEASALLSAPGLDTLKGVRDTAIISLLLCTGLREAELCALNVSDLRRRLGGEISLHVRHGKGAKGRLIPYGDLDWCLAIVECWMVSAGITSGSVFRGFYRGAKRVRSTRLTVRAINQILDQYPIMIAGELKTVNPHDLRRTYARRLYESGMDLLAIRDNLGHADTRTTLKYIGEMDVDKRKPPTLYTFNIAALRTLSSQ